MEEQIKIVKGNITGEDSTYIRRGTGNIEFDSNTHKILLDGVNYSGDTLIETTYSELRDLRDNELLIPGCWYRITDYTCTTIQENTRAVHNNFDIIVLALSNDTLSEEARAIMHPSDIYDVTFGNGITKKGYLYCYDGYCFNFVDAESLLGFDLGVGIEDGIEINPVNKTASVPQSYYDSSLEENILYNYFSNSKSEAWKIWYCLDNDKSRFGWADDGENPAIVIDIAYYRNSHKDTTINGINVYAWSEEGLEDDASFYTLTPTPKVGDEVYADDSMTYPDIIRSVSGFGRGVVYRLIDEYNNDCPYDFKNIQFKRKLTDGEYDPDNGEDTWVYTFNVIINEVCQDASVIGNTLTTDEQSVAGVYGNKMGIRGLYEYDSGIQANSFITILNNNVFLTSYYPGEYYGCHDNTFENECYGNTLVGRCTANTFGHQNHQNVLNGYCERNVFKNYCTHNVLGDHCFNNIFESDCHENVLGDLCSDNVFGGCCWNNKLGKRCECNIFLNGCTNIIFGNSSSVKNYYQDIIIESGNIYIYLDKNHNNPIRNITIAQGVNNTGTYKTITHTTANDNFQTIYRPANSQIVSV